MARTPNSDRKRQRQQVGLAQCQCWLPKMCPCAVGRGCSSSLGCVLSVAIGGRATAGPMWPRAGLSAKRCIIRALCQCVDLLWGQFAVKIIASSEHRTHERCTLPYLALPHRTLSLPDLFLTLALLTLALLPHASFTL